MNCIKKVFSLVVLCFSIIMTYAQQAPFGVKGTVVDVESYQPLAGVTVTIANSQLGTTTNDKGEFYIPLPSDKSAEYLIRASLMGYDAQELNFTLQANDTEFVSFALKNADAVIEEVVITRRREKFSELALLEERKKSNLMIESIGAQELSRKGVSDARAALVKMAGVSRQEGAKNVFVRGLGDRYNSSTLNGLPLPSEDPLFKNISLDFFSSDIIQSINVNKTFNAQIHGDVAGANIDIHTKEATDNSFEINVGGGVNSQTIGKDNFKRIDGTNYFGTLAGAKPGITSLENYNFKNNWNPNVQNNLFNTNFRLLGNKRFMVGNNPLSLFFVAGMDSKYRYADGKIQNATNIGEIYLDQDFVKNEYTVSQNAMLNLRYVWGQNSISFNSLYIHDQKQDFTEFFGKGDNEEEGDKEFSRRQQVNDNHLFVNQILTNLKINERLGANLSAGFNYIIGNEPDRRINNFLFRNNVMTFSTNSPGENERFFSDMKEKGFVAKGILTYKLDDSQELERKIDFGYNGNFVTRNFYNTVFNHRLIGTMPSSIDIENVDQYFNQANLGSLFELETQNGRTDRALDEFYYTGKKNIHSGLAAATYQFNQDFTAVLGLRFDNIYQDVVYYFNLSSTATDGPSTIKKNYFLPSLNLKYVLNDKMILRASGSKSYVLPQFIELARMQYAGINQTIEGNPKLVPAQVYNADLKWELYPTSSELISAGVFYKTIENPISRVYSTGAGNLMTFINTGSNATVLGAEVEIKKELLRHSNAYGDNVLAAGANVSYLFSKQKLEDPTPQFTNTEDQLEGASPWIVNADISYKANFSNFELMPTLVFNYFSDRIYTLGSRGFQNLMEKGVPTLDFNMSSTIKKKFGINLKVENILNPDREYYREFQDQANPLLIESYKRGVDFSLGLSYKF